MKSKAIIFIGRSGCGKGTQSDLLTDYFKTLGEETVYLSTGNEFRALIAEGDNFTSKKVNQIYEEGERHPDFLCVTILGNFFKNKYTTDKNLIMDGGLRSLHEAESVDEIFNFYEIENSQVFYLDVSHEWSVDKLKRRNRHDDTEEIFVVKKEWFDKEVMPAIEYLKQNTRFDFHAINGEQDTQKVHEDIVACLK
jgi:adenylate kinase family enzyme